MDESGAAYVDLTPEDSRSWRPEIAGWSDDILPCYARWARYFEAGMPGNPRVFTRFHGVEVGCYRGRSLLFLAERLLRGSVLTGIEPGWASDEKYPGDREDTIFRDCATELNRHVQDHNARVLGGGPGALVQVLPFPSPLAAAGFADHSLSLVFLDGDHREEALFDEICAWAPKLRSPGAILAGHDYGHPHYPGVRRAVDKYAAATRRKLQVVGSVWSFGP